MNITFLTECGEKVGFGHFMRCLAIASAYKEKGINPKLIICVDKNIVQLQNYDYDIKSFDWISKFNQLIKNIEKTDLLVIDSISISKDYYSKVINKKDNVLFIDDYHRWKHKRGVIVDWTVGKEKNFNFKKNNAVSYLYGAKYTALRKEFWLPKPKVHSKTIREILISFGGSDIYNMTPKILKLITANYPSFKINVIIGKAFSNIPEIISESNINTELIYYPDAVKMKESMEKSDIAIGSGGQTLYELASLGIPAIAILLVDNQIEDTRGWSEKGFLFDAGWYNQDLLEQSIIKFLEKLKNYKLRKSMGKIGQLNIDGKGAKRIADYSIDLLK